MGIMNFSIPDDVKNAFDQAFDGDDKNAIVAELLRKAAEEKTRKQSRQGLVDQMREMHAVSATHGQAKITAARQSGRP
jgi:hypothetical protein